MSNPSTLLAREIMGILVGAGVREVVLAPGSRSAPLAFAAYGASSAGAVRLHTRLDERTAGFLALGMARTSRRPVVVLCTSGTAVANLHPAVLEAAHVGLPLVLLTADRPAGLRGTSANQTTDQVEVFPHVRFADLSAANWASGAAALRALLAPDAGPVHVNVQLEEPLLPDVDADTDDWVPGLPSATIGHPAQTTGPSAEGGGPTRIPMGPRTVVVAGDDAGPPARVLAERAGWPLLAEPTAGCRTGENALRCYRLLLDGPLADRVERVLVFGHPTLSRPVTRLLNRPGLEVWAAPTAGVWSARPFPIAGELSAGVAPGGPDALPPDPTWLEEWRTADRQVARRLDELLAAEPDLTPHEVAGAVSRAVPPGGLLHVGASSPIRDLDLMVAKYAVGGRRKVIANRGLAGIDGTVSSAVGAALARPHGTRNLALLGDVTFLHDSTGLILGPREARPDLTIVVVNDDGGAIFTMLEQGGPAYADRYDTLFGTPHGVDVGSLCAATHTPHWRVDTLPELEHALASPNGGIEVIEVPVRRDNRRDLDERIRSLRP